MPLHALSSAVEAPAVHPDTDRVLGRVGARRKRRRWLAWLLLLVVAGAGAFYYTSRAERGAAISYETVPAELGDLEIHVIATGSLQARSTVSVGAELSGRVESVAVDVNDRVTKGQVLVTLAPDTFRHALSEAEATLRSASADVTRSKSSLSATETLRKRVDSLKKQGLASIEEDDTQRAASDVAKADLTRTKAQAALAKIRVDQAKTDLSKLVILAPIDGIVLSRTVEPGNTISASLSAPVLFTIAEDLAKMELHLPIHEADVARVRADQKATFRVDAWPDREFTAKVVEVSFAPVVTTNVVTYTAVLEVDNADLSLRPGMTATATIVSDVRKDALRVPNAALRFTPPRDDSRSTNPLQPRMRGMGGRGRGGGRGEPPGVWVLRDGAPVRVRVTGGATDGAFTEIVGGELQTGDEVIVSATRSRG